VEIRVEFYGVLQEVVGTAAAAWPLATDDCTVSQLLDELRERFPGLAAHMPRLAFAVGDQIVPRGHPLRSGDTLALLPPVSGG